MKEVEWQCDYINIDQNADWSLNGEWTVTFWNSFQKRSRLRRLLDKAYWGLVEVINKLERILK